MSIVHLTASRFYGGPERQIVGLARRRPQDRAVILSFREDGRCRSFLEKAHQLGLSAFEVAHDTPQLRSAIHDIEIQLKRHGARILLCHGYKARLLGRVAAQRCSIPAIGVCRGWTAETWRVRVYESIDRLGLRRLDRIVCVSKSQAKLAGQAGVPKNKIRIIPNAIALERLDSPDCRYRKRLQRLFGQAPSHVVGAAGRLSPEKGFGDLVAAAGIAGGKTDVGFVLFGEGRLRGELQRQIDRAGLNGRFVIAGFHHDLEHYLPWFDVLAIPSHSEGMPNIALEAMARAVPVVATTVGGIPELIDHGVSGRLVPPRRPDRLSDEIVQLIADEKCRRRLGAAALKRIREHFSFEAQSQRYQDLFDELIGEAAGIDALVSRAG